MTHRTSKEWLEEIRKKFDLTIIDPDGWDRANYHKSFNCQLITKQEFLSRLERSTLSFGDIKDQQTWEQFKQNWIKA